MLFCHKGNLFYDPELSFCCIWSSMACIFLISWSFWWSSIIVSGSSYSLSAGAMLSLRKEIVQKWTPWILFQPLWRHPFPFHACVSNSDSLAGLRSGYMTKSRTKKSENRQPYMYCTFYDEFQPGLSALQGMWVGSSRNGRRGSRPSDPDKHQHWIVKVR